MKIVNAVYKQGAKSTVSISTNDKGVQLPGHVISNFFTLTSSPPDLSSGSTSQEAKTFKLNPGEIRFIQSDIYPTKPVHQELLMDKSIELEELFYHSTPSIDFFVVTKGELVLLIDDKKIDLKPGDIIIQQGSAHAWHNYTDEVASIVGVMVGAKVPEDFTLIDTSAELRNR